MSTAQITELNHRLGDPAGDLDTELAQLTAMREVTDIEAKTIETAFSTFPNCCTLAQF